MGIEDNEITAYEIYLRLSFARCDLFKIMDKFGDMLGQSEEGKDLYYWIKDTDDRLLDIQREVVLMSQNIREYVDFGRVNGKNVFFEIAEKRTRGHSSRKERRVMAKNIENTLEKAIKDAYGEGYATGWADALQMAADLLGRIAKQRKYADANRLANARNEE